MLDWLHNLFIILRTDSSLSLVELAISNNKNNSEIEGLVELGYFHATSFKRLWLHHVI